MFVTSIPRTRCLQVPGLLGHDMISPSEPFCEDNLGGSPMQVIDPNDRTPELIDAPVIVWERSVRATHLFLRDEARGCSRTVSATWA